MRKTFEATHEFKKGFNLSYESKSLFEAVERDDVGKKKDYLGKEVQGPVNSFSEAYSNISLKSVNTENSLASDAFSPCFKKDIYSKCNLFCYPLFLNLSFLIFFFLLL